MIRGSTSKFNFSNISTSLSQLLLYHSLSRSRRAVFAGMSLRSLCSMDGARQPFFRGEETTGGSSDGPFARRNTTSVDAVGTYNRGRQNPPDPIPNRLLRGEKPIHQSERPPPGKFDFGGKHFGDYKDDDDGGGGRYEHGKSAAASTHRQKNYKPAARVGGNRTPWPPVDKFGHDDEGEQKMNKYFQASSPQQPSSSGKQRDNFLEKFKLGFDKGEKPLQDAVTTELHQGVETVGDQAVAGPPPDADDIFKKMKETGLIPNAVAMLDGLCKDGLVQEAMKLFGLMREKGTIPEVVIYTAVVEGFCKAQKFDDAKRIFRKMQSNGISPNAFSYTVLIQGLCKGKSLKDALDFCAEMLEAGHSLNLATFTGLVDGFCREKGVEEAQNVIGTLRQKGFFFDEKAVRDYLDKKGPFLPLVWEAILGKKSSLRSF